MKIIENELPFKIWKDQIFVRKFLEIGRCFYISAAETLAWKMQKRFFKHWFKKLIYESKIHFLYHIIHHSYIGNEEMFFLKNRNCLTANATFLAHLKK